MLNHVWLDYIVLENNEIKGKIFAVQRAPTWGQVGPPCGAGWTTLSSVGKKFTKIVFLIEQIAIQIQKDYVKHQC